MLFDYSQVTPSSVAADTETTIAQAETIVSKLIAADGPRTFANTMGPLEKISSVMSDLYGQGPFLAHVSADPDILDAARVSQEQHAQWMSDLVYRDDLYKAVAEFAKTPEAKSLTGEPARLLEHNMRTFRLAGHELSPEARQELRDTNKRLVELGVAFSNNLTDYQDYLVVTRPDLDGLPDSYIDQLKPGEEKDTYCVSMDYPDVVPFMESATIRAKRQDLSKKFNSRAVARNRPILEETVQLRRRVAEIFELPSWAHWRMQEKMAKNPEAVDKIYESLRPPLTVAAQIEVAKMSAMLWADEDDTVLQKWDSAYYENLIRQREFGVFSDQIAEYFSLARCVEGMLTITGHVFGLDYECIDETNAWHDDVMLYRVADRASGDHLAYFYMDLFPREGKFGHAAAFDLVHAKHENGVNVRPVSAVLANFTKPTSDRPSLLKHAEVLTLFHEFGHILHMSLAQTQFTDFSGANTEWDFVEAPSQIMEHWCWKPEVLTTFAYHYETHEAIPTELIDQLTAARDLNVAIKTLGQIAYGTLDMAIHGTAAMSLDDALVSATDVTVFSFQEGTFFPASFGHLYGYDAGYYGYLWSEVFGDDMFSEFEKAGVINPEIGMRYRKTILEPNGSKDAVDLLDDFLGRPPSNTAFLKKLGITT
jgi:thimet oligopeptidase